MIWRFAITLAQALLQIKEVIERVTGFGLDNPIIKFLQGIEILLTKAQVYRNDAEFKFSSD